MRTAGLWDNERRYTQDNSYLRSASCLMGTVLRALRGPYLILITLVSYGTSVSSCVTDKETGLRGDK